MTDASPAQTEEGPRGPQHTKRPTATDLLGRRRTNNTINNTNKNAATATSTSEASSTQTTTTTTLPAQPPTLSLRTLTIPTEIRHLLAGGLAGMLAKTVVAPIDRIKILFQVTPLPFKLRNVPHLALNIVQHEGILALWRGNSAMMLRVFPYSGIQFMVFDACKSHFLQSRYGSCHDNDGMQQQHGFGLTPWESLMAGSVAGMVSVIATYPLDLTRAQLAVHYKKKGCDGGRPKFRTVLYKTFSDKGITGLFRGITPTMLGILPYAGIAFTINEQSKKRIRMATNRPPTTFEKMISGGLAGLVAQSVTYPFEVTRRRMQTIGLVEGSFVDQWGSRHGGSSSRGSLPNVAQQPQQASSASAASGARSPMMPPPSMVDTMRHLHGEQGVRGFFKGLSMNWMKGPIAFSISFTAYDLIKGYIDGGVVC